MLRMIETRPRRGMFMAQPDLLTGIEKVMNPLILSSGSLRDIFKMRLILESGMAEFLFARKSEEDLNEPEAIIHGQSGSQVSPIGEEVAFHGKLYEMTGNETLK